MVKTRKEIGTQAERLAQDYLESNGLSLIDKNVTCRQGEIDLVMLDKQILVFVEVKYRKSNIFAAVEESVSYAKQQRLLHTSLFYLQQFPEYAKYQARFDVVLITKMNNQNQIKWISNAFHA